MYSKLTADIELQRLLDMIYAPMYTKILFAAIELDLFSELDEAKTYTEVAANLKLHPENTRHLLNALTGMELMVKEKEYYKNTSAGSKYLVLGKELYLGDFLRAYNISSGFEGANIARLVESGPDHANGYEQGMQTYTEFGDMNELMKSIQRGARAREITNMVSEIPEFPHFKKMLDLGGGPGLLGMAVVKKHPYMKGVVFDLPEVGKTAFDLIRENELEGRMKVMTGDYMQDSIGSGYDFVLAVGTLNFAKHDLDGIIKKIYHALNPGGVLLSISDGMTHQDTRPKEMTASWLPSLLRGLDFRMRQGQVSEAALQNGFCSVYKQTINMLTGPMDVDVIRK